MCVCVFCAFVCGKMRVFVVFLCALLFLLCCFVICILWCDLHFFGARFRGLCFALFFGGIHIYMYLQYMN